MFLMREMLDMPFKEIADVVGCPENTVKSTNALRFGETTRTGGVRGSGESYSVAGVNDMMQCCDIDEQMVDFLYHELDNTQQAAPRRTSTGERGAELESLVRTRQAMKALPMAEPPSAGTAMLLHAAAQRTPTPDKKEEPGIWAAIIRFFEPLSAHPAWAAAATLLWSSARRRC